MYQEHSHAGSSSELWEENWEAAGLEQSLQFCNVDPLRPLFEKYAGKGSLMLEGGCGMGQYVIYYTLKGVRVIGLDFAQKALKRLNKRVPDLDLCAGNVAALPFRNGVFDVYYSGGVVEHFESGAEESLREAYRVLKNDGVLLISVPYFNPLRRALSPFRKDVWKRVNDSKMEKETENGYKFFQYAYRPHEFVNMLEEVGFEVLEKQGYAVLWGLSELPFMGGNSEIRSSANGSEEQKPKEVEKTDLAGIDTASSDSLLKRLVVREDASVPVLGLGVRVMRWAFANMMMYVCKKSGKTTVR